MRKLTMSKAATAEKTTKKVTAVKTAAPKSILESFESIVEMVEDSNLEKDFYDKASMHIRYAAGKLKLTPIQVVLLSIFVDRSEDNHILLSEIAKYIGCRTTKILRLMDDINVLEEQRYIRVNRNKHCMSFRVPAQVLDSLVKNQPYIYTPQPITDTQAFFDYFSNVEAELEDDELTYEALKQQTLENLEKIKDSVFATNLRQYQLDEENLLLFIYMAHLFVNNNDNNILISDISRIYDNRAMPMFIRRALCCRRSILFLTELIENVNEDGLANSEAFKLTDKAKEKLLSELDLMNAGANVVKGLVKASDLTPKKLIYNSSEQKQIEQLTSVLSEEKFQDVQKRLRAMGMRPGFCCMFYGAPGTGKTETVYQIARLTNRDIMRVDVDKIKSCWVGESEKNIKKLFDTYRSLCKNVAKTPILLFNEADAVLGVRMEGASRSVDKMENSIQNIILQEMETLEGIMIATTNLTGNLDKAFERRFLYKIRFDKPTIEARTQIWQTMLGGLTRQNAETLASQFDLSGGEIENIARRQSVSAILTGKEELDLNELISSCRLERIAAQPRRAIGF